MCVIVFTAGSHIFLYWHGFHQCSASVGELDALQGVMGEGDQKEMLSRLISKVATLETAVAEVEAKRRALHNQMVELRGNVRSALSFLLKNGQPFLLFVPPLFRDSKVSYTWQTRQ